MTLSSYVAFYSVTSETINITFGITLNSLLLFLIRKYSNAYLGNYKYLLAIFAVYDIYLCTIHGLFNPFVTVQHNTFGAALYSPFQNQALSASYFSFFSLPFTLMNIHFIYRFWSIANPGRLALFAKPSFLVKLAFYPIFMGFAWFSCAYAIRADPDEVGLVEIKEIFSATHSVPVEDGWLVMDHWRNGELCTGNVIYAIIVTMIIIFSSLFAAASIGVITYLEILKATSLSQKLIRMQYTLLIAVIAQTFIPVFCVYIPYFLIIMVPFLRIPGFGLVNNFSFLVSFFPGWDAVVIILLIKDYRVGLSKTLGIYKPMVVIVKHTQFTTNVYPTTVSTAAVSTAALQ